MLAEASAALLAYHCLFRFLPTLGRLAPESRRIGAVKRHNFMATTEWEPWHSSAIVMPAGSGLSPRFLPAMSRACAPSR